MRYSSRRWLGKLLPIPTLTLVALLVTVFASRTTSAEDSSAVVTQLLDWTDIDRGVCAVVGAHGGLALELARNSNLLVHVRDTDALAVAQLRQAADSAGLGIQRLAVEQGRTDRLPYTDNTVDLLVIEQASAKWLNGTEVHELLRVLRPDGMALVSGDVEPAIFDNWAANAAHHVESGEGILSGWMRITKPANAGIDEWTHWEKSPDNNPVSADQLIKAPYMTQFMAEPFYIGMPSVTTIAGGRTFLAIGHIAHHRREWGMLNKLIARNGYNGTILWTRNLPEGYLVHRSAFVATADTFYMMDDDRCLALDTRTGQQQREIRIPGLKGEWKWMSIQNDVLYVLAGEPGPGTETIKGDRTTGGWSWGDLSKGYYGKRIQFSLGDTLAAYDLRKDETIWIHAEETLIDARGMSLREGRLFLYCPERHLRCLAANSGEALWTNDEPDVLELIAEPGRGLRSTPGFRTACIAVATPRALIVQGQTRMNVVAVSTDSGSLLWTKKKITNNPNAIYVDGNIILGVGPDGSHVVMDPVTGQVIEDLEFHKVACTRLTASTDSFFCRGEGLMRFDRESKKPMVDGAVRPGCNDGALPANGLLYLGPWQCDCNLSLIGRIAKCSAGDFDFDVLGTDAERLELKVDDVTDVAALAVTGQDWPTYRQNNHRTAGTPVDVAADVKQQWRLTPAQPYVPTTPTAAGGLVFVAGEDGKVRAIESKSGELSWEFSTPCPIKYPPTIWNGRAYVGSGDGFVYALEAATGRLLWRFRAAPSERHLMVYGTLNSTWPVASGVLVDEGVAYFAAGIVDHDGTYVYALDAETGEMKWQNGSSGHLNPELRKGVSVQGNLTILGDRLMLAGGNQVSPAPYDIATGQCLAEPFDQGWPKANHGRFVGVFQAETVIAGGRILYADPANVASKGGFDAHFGKQPHRLNYGGVPPAWHENTLAMVNYKRGRLTCCDGDQVAALIQQGPADGAARRGESVASAIKASDTIRWQTDLDHSEKFETVALAVCPNTIVAVLQYQDPFRSQPQWYVAAFAANDGTLRFRRELPGEPLPDGLLVDRDGQVVVCMIQGDVVCWGPG